jgi:putative Ca2+/H+ antiporter (TMEM165/GDT1 family)
MFAAMPTEVGITIQSFMVPMLVVFIAELPNRGEATFPPPIIEFNRPSTRFAVLALAVLGNQLLAAGLATAIAATADPAALRWVLASIFIFAAWLTLRATHPEKNADQQAAQTGYLNAMRAYGWFPIGRSAAMLTGALVVFFGYLIPVVAGASLGLVAALIDRYWLVRRFPLNVPDPAAREAAALMLGIMAIMAVIDFPATSLHTR